MSLLPITLTKNNLDKLLQHKSTRFSHDQLRGGPHRLFLKPRKYNRVQTAIRKGKGINLMIDKDELKHLSSGGALPQFMKTRIRGLVHDGINHIAPRVQRKVQTLAQPIVGRKAARHLSSASTLALHHGADQLGDLTGAYGLRDDLRRFHRAIKPALRMGIKTVGRAGADFLAPGMGQFTGRLVDGAVDSIGNATVPLDYHPAVVARSRLLGIK